MRIWIDISNAPHVHFFRSLIDSLEKDGHEVLVTARRYGYIEPLLDYFGIDATIVGRHGGSDRFSKLVASSERILELADIVRRFSPDIALFKHSVEGARVSFGLGIPSIAVVDNEQADIQNRLIVPLSTILVVPSAIPKRYFEKLGARRMVRFRGVCEVSHFRNFEPNDRILDALGLERDDKIAVFRPEPYRAEYMRNGGRSGILELVDKAIDLGFKAVYFPRSEEDYLEVRRRFEDSVLIPLPHNALDLLAFSDLMVGAGGTMNREAALLGVRTISCYPNGPLAVDRFLERLGFLIIEKNPKRIIEIMENVRESNTLKPHKPRLYDLEDPIDKIHGILMELESSRNLRMIAR